MSPRVKRVNIAFSVLLSLFVCWQLLLPGYVMTLDASYGPHVPFPEFAGNYFSNYIWKVITYFLANILGTMLFQKVLIFSLFFCLFYFPLLFFPFGIENKYKYVASFLFAINPFVMERFLAGQWGILLAYACLFPFIYFQNQFLQNWKTQSMGLALLSVFIIGVFSPHFFVIALILFCLSFIWIDKQSLQKNWKKYFLLFLFFVVANMYWLYPTLFSGGGVLESFGPENFDAFKTNVFRTGLGTFMGIFSLYGFWGEREVWATQFGIVPFVNFVYFFPILLISFFGLATIFRKNRKVGVYFTLVIFLGAVFSLGVSENWFKEVNEFLFNNVFFWKGFRDSQKWSGVIALILAIGLSLGLQEVSQYIKYTFLKFLSIFTIFIFLCIYSVQMFVGVWLVLQPTEFPKSWEEVNVFFKSDRVEGRKCEAVYLPWHMYSKLSFNNDLLTASPAPKYFDCTIYTSLDPEFHSIGDSPVNDKKWIAVHKVLNSGLETEDKISLLQDLGIDYILLSYDEIEPKYIDFLVSERVIHILDRDEIVLLKLIAKL